jgi:hypothetical protein
MKKTQLLLILPALVLTGISACNTTPLNTQLQPMAIDYAVKRARFDMNCPTATATVISSEVIQAPDVGIRFQGIQRAQYTIGVSGCDQRQTMVVLCAQGGNGCFAADGR